MENGSKLNLTTTPKKEKRFLVLLAFVILIAVGCFFSEEHAYFNPGNRVMMTDVEFWLSFVVVFVYLVFFVLLINRHYPVKPNRFLLIFYLIFLAIGLSAILFYPGLYDTGDLVYTLSASLKARYCCGFFIEATCFYLFLDYGPKIIRGSGTLDFLFAIIVADCLIAIVYSYATEWRLYFSIFSNGPRSSYAVPQSFTNNRNVYAALLFYGLICECYLITRNPHWWRWPIVAFLFINQSLLMSKTIFVISALFLASFLVFRYIFTLKVHPIRNNVALGIFLTALALVIAWPLSGLSAKFTPRVEVLFDTYFDLILNSISDSFVARLYDWDGILKELTKSPLTVFFGFGESNYRYIINYINPILATGEAAPLDSAYIAVATKYGFLGFVLYLVFLGYLVFLLVKGLNSHRVMSIPYGLAFVSFLATGLFEGHYYLGFQSPNLILLLTVALPVLSGEYSSHHQEEQNYAVSLYQRSLFLRRPLPKSPRDILRISYFVLTPIFSILVGCILGFSSAWGITRISSPLLLLSFACLYFLLPVFLASLRALKSLGHSVAYVFLWIFVATWVIASLATPFIGHVTYAVLAAVGYGIAILLGLTFSSMTIPFSIYLSYSYRYLLAFLASVAIDSLLGWLINPLSRYLIFLFAVGDFLIWFSCFSTWNCYADIRPVCDIWDSLEMVLSKKELVRQWRWEAWQNKCQTKKAH